MFWTNCCSSCTPRSFFSIRENKLVGYTNDATLIVVVPFPGIRVTVAESLIHDHGKLSEWCDLWGMNLNVSKTKTVIVLGHAVCIPSPTLIIGGTVLKESNDLDIVGVTFDSKITFGL